MNTNKLIKKNKDAKKSGLIHLYKSDDDTVFHLNEKEKGQLVLIMQGYKYATQDQIYEATKLASNWCRHFSYLKLLKCLCSMNKSSIQNLKRCNAY